jgi:serine/threonine protein kinase
VTIYGNRWRIVGSLGRGGQSEVFRVVDLRNEFSGEYALKRIRNPARHARFLNEIEAIKRLDHPNVIKLIDHSALDNAGTSGDKHFMVMPLAHGGDLSERAAIYKNSLDSTLNVIQQITAAVAAAHRANIIHRDIKPENVLFLGTGHDAMLADFGICLLREQGRVTETAEVVGPWSFMAPELEGGGQLDVSAAADIYSLGKLVYYMLSGGVVLPRERLADSDYIGLFSSGERYLLLHILLNKMICPLSSRLRDMNDVIAELEAIERWEQNARLAPINLRTQTALDQMKQRELANIATISANESARAEEVQRLAMVSNSCLDWLRTELELAAAAISAPGVVESTVHALSSEEAEAPDVPIPLKDANVLRPLGGFEVAMSRVSDVFNRRHALQLLLFQKRKVAIQFGGGARPEPARDLGLVLFPFYRVQTMGDHHSMKVFLNRQTVRAQVGVLTRSFIGGTATVFAEFRLSQWPSAVKDLQPILVEAIEIFVEQAQKDGLIVGA